MIGFSEEIQPNKTCPYNPIMVYTSQECTHRQLLNALIHVELQKCRMYINYCECGKHHSGWFDVNLRKILFSIHLWIGLIEYIYASHYCRQDECECAKAHGGLIRSLGLVHQAFSDDSEIRKYALERLHIR
jgi:T5orf172 domain